MLRCSSYFDLLYIQSIGGGVLAWLSVWSEVQTVSCFSKIQIDVTFLVLAHPGSPRQMAIKWVCVCVCVHTYTLAHSLTYCLKKLC